MSPESWLRMHAFHGQGSKLRGEGELKEEKI